MVNEYTAHVHLVETGRERNPDDVSILWVCQTNKLGPRLLVYNRCLLVANTGVVFGGSRNRFQHTRKSSHFSP